LSYKDLLLNLCEMCGRFSLALTKEELELFCELGIPLSEPWAQRYNVCPSERLPVITKGGAGLQAQWMSWGLKPAWAKAGGPAPINARSETVFDKAFFRKSILARKALVPATSFFEWRREKSGKQPFAIYCGEEKIFYFAAIYENETFALLTCSANSSITKLHDRMPLILGKEDLEAWWSVHSPQDLEAVVQRVQAKRFDLVAVSKAVNSPGADGPEILEPLPLAI
jgi:putative SOS response-associated peptidase YedK